MADTLAPGTPTPSGLTLHLWNEFPRTAAVDYHLHTDYTDGTASPRQMAEAAASQGIKDILFSEHVRHTSTYYPSFVSEVRGLSFGHLSVRVGIETKVLDTDGTLDCSPGIASMCDAIVGSVHNPPPDSRGTAQSWSQLDPAAAQELEFGLAMAIVTKSRAHVLAHPMGMAVTRFGLRPCEQAYELACACKAFNKAFELNTRYCPSPSDWLDIVQRAGCKVSFGSDAHKPADVGSAWHLFTGQTRGT